MSAAARGAAGYLFASGRIRNRDALERRRRVAVRAAESLREEREAQQTKVAKVTYRRTRLLTAPEGAKER